MKNTNCLGIWMDHEHAHFIEYTVSPITMETIDSKFTNLVREDSIHKSEKLMHEKEQHQNGEYFKIISEKIKHYTDVLLFGPTTAKNELFNLLRSNHLFDKIVIDVVQKDKMTEHQEQAFVRDFFHKKNINGIIESNE
jgi:hypothetical protein